MTARWGSRKLWVAILSMIIASVLVWFGKIDGGAWSAAFMATIAVYLSSQAYVDKGQNDGSATGNSN